MRSPAIAAAVLALLAPSTAAAGAGSHPFATRLAVHGYRLELRVAPNRATVSANATLVLTKQGHAVNGARVRLTYVMLDMPMTGIVRALAPRGRGRYADAGPVLGMSGRWGLTVRVAPLHESPFTVRLVDRMSA